MAIRLVLASGNPGKVAEIVEILGDRFEVAPRPADLADTIEDADTLEGNAIKKASEVASATGAWALADDTGLFVEALDGAPGVHTARYAGDGATGAENVAKLLGALTDPDPDVRGAEFRTVVALIGPDGGGVTAEGSVTGWIAAEGRGDGGFGYDPVFVPDDGDGRTFAEMSAEEKHELSHRGRALDALLTALDHAPPPGLG